MNFLLSFSFFFFGGGRYFIYLFFFLFSLTSGHMGEKLQTSSPLKVSLIFTPPKACMPLGRVYKTKGIQSIVQFRSLDICYFFVIFFSFLLT